MRCCDEESPPLDQNVDGANAKENVDVHVDHSYASQPQSEECQDKPSLGIQDKIIFLENTIKELELKPAKKKAMSVNDIKDDKEKFFLYTALSYDIFVILLLTLQRFDFQYYFGWTVQSLHLEDQLLITLMKLRLNLRDLDLAERFCTSRTTISNIVKTLIDCLQKLLFLGIMNRIPSQLKCKGSLPKSFDDFISAQVVIDATEITQDIPKELNKQAASYSRYKSRHTVKTGVAPNAAIVFCSDLYPGSTSDVSIVQHSNLLEQLSPGDLILADKGFTLHRILPNGVNLNMPPFLTGKSQNFV